MKSFLQNTALVASIVLLASCGGGGGPSTIDVPPFEDPPVSGVEGQVMKGPIIGATITVEDSSFEMIATTETVTTDDTGSYSARFTVPAIEAGIDTPIIVISTGGEMVCDYDVGGLGCPVSEGVYVAVGDTFALPEDFGLLGYSTILAGDDEESVVVNINIASAIAVGLAEIAAETAGGPISDEQLAVGQGQALGLIQLLTGVDLSGINLRTQALPNLAAVVTSAELTEQTFALALFGSSFIGQIDFANADLANIDLVLVNVFESLSINADGNLQAPGTILARAATAIADGIDGIEAQYATAGETAPDYLATIRAHARSIAALFGLSGDNPVVVAPPPDSGSDDPLDQTKQFVATLSSVINAALVTTGAQGFGGTQQGVTEVFADELDSVAQLSSGAATQAFSQLLDSIGNALDTGDGVADGGSVDLSGDGVTGSLSRSEDGLTDSLTDVESTFTDGDVTVTVAIPSGSHWEDGTAGSLMGTGITMTTWQGEALLQTFSGDINLTFVTENDDLGLNAATFDGWITTEAAEGTFMVNAELSNITGTTEEGVGTSDLEADYVVTFSFADLVISMNGRIYENNQSFAITAGGSTIWGTVARDGDTDTDTLTDMTTTLTLVLDLSGNGELVSGTFTVAGEETATMDDQGIVYYSDGSIQALPAAVF